jgi:hypothetical protein
VIVLAAWILVDTLMRFLIGNGGQFENGTPWSDVQCWSQVLPGFQTFEREEFSLGSFALNQPGGSGGGSAASCVAAPSGPCSPSALAQSGFGALANDAAIVLAAESRCRTDAESGTDTTTDGRTYSVGLWQINLAAHSLSCNGTTLNCPDAFRSTGQRNKYNVRVQEIIDEDLYQACVAAAKNPACNSAKAAELAEQAGDLRDWACSARKCGISTPLNNKCPL